MKRKIGVALGIFLLLFSGCWFLDQKQARTAEEMQVTEGREGTMNISNVKINQGSMFDQITINFLPREYIRIQQNSRQ
ncbi:hypothetical protein [Bacillus marasmi]|uniref:hypothetical protein n=1 Tax=Bacillus marasmi TaxID=1926279 RepID=UPI0011CBB269|nr:hypothetical protein [Bacillus marasmi]